MSFVTARWHLDGSPLDESLLRRMSQVLPQGAPDGCWTWADRSIGLTYARLIETPEGTGDRQPIVVGNLHLLADVRLDNREELLGHVGRPVWSDDSDAEIVAALVKREGLSVFGRLYGDFACVVWDAKRHELHCVRDPFGMRTLYWTAVDGILTVASTIEHLFTDSALPRALDQEAVDDFLCRGYYSRWDMTIYRAIRQVLPGHVTTFRADRGRATTRFFEPPPDAVRRDLSASDHVERVREGLQAAVRATIRAPGQVGIMLSGGLDSGSLAGVAAAELRTQGRPPSTLRAYSMAFERCAEVDERRFFLPLVEALGIESEICWPERFTPFQGNWDAAEPTSSSTFDPTWELACRALYDRGGRVCLTGFGGETLFLSQSRLQLVDWARSGRVVPFIREARRWHRLGVPWIRLVPRRETLRRLTPNRFIPRSARHRAEVFPPWLRHDDCARQRRTDRWQAGPELRRYRSLARQVAYERLYGCESAATLWPSYAQGGHRTGVSYRHPFMDRRLHEIVFSTPLEYFFDLDHDRAILRHAIKDFVPDVVRLRQVQTLFDPWYSTRPGVERLLDFARENADLLNELDVIDRGGFRLNPEMRKRFYLELNHLCIMLDWYRSVSVR